MIKLSAIFLLLAPLVKALPQAPIKTIDQVGSPNIPIVNAGVGDIIPNRYIVVYNNSFNDEAIATRQASFSAAIKRRNLHKRGLVGQLLSTEIQSFKMVKWRAMALDADDSMIMHISGADEVSYIEADHWVSTCTTLRQTNAPPGITRLSHGNATAQGYVFDSSAGAGITVYVIDTGVRATHSEFQGRATLGANFVDNVVCPKALSPSPQPSA